MMSKHIVSILFLCLIAAGMSTYTHGDVIHVKTTTDSVPGSLRTALTTADTNNEDGTIYLPAGTYFLTGEPGEDGNTGGDLDIDTAHSIAIIGDSAGSTIIDGGGVDRVFHILKGTVSISGVTIRNGVSPSGMDGGGIYNYGTLTLTDCELADNRTGSGHVEQEGGDGAGLYNGGTAVLINCTIGNNTAGNGSNECEFAFDGGNGGGIFNIKTLALTNCTISGNAAGNGGDEYCIDTDNPGEGGSGGGIYNSGETTLTNCTIYNNTTGELGDGFSHGTDGNGGGIWNETGTVLMKNTIVSGNSVYFFGKGPDFYGTLNSLGYNIIKDTADCTVTGTFTGNISGVDPMPAPLADNGGPTRTCALSPGSPAVDAGDSTGISTDQRGYPRPVDIPGIDNASDGADIGAYEYSPPSPPEISMNRIVLNFGADTAGLGTTSLPVFISNSGGGTLEWSTVSDAGWLETNPASGTGAGEITVSVDIQNLAAGTYTGTITVEAPDAVNSSQTIHVRLDVYPAGSTLPPFGLFETPIAGSTVSGSIPVTGWVLDDIGVQAVKIYRAEGNGTVYIGDALFVEGARPDVEESFPTYPQAYRAGWGYMLLSHFLPDGGNGTFTLLAEAVDMEGNEVTLGSKTITCDNAGAVNPFGAIDTPTQGGTASGSEFINFGWALTPQPNAIPIDGSTISVFVDGVSLGNPTYNIYREDIASLFPGYANSNGAVGYFTIDTAQYENGVHTISWVVEDDAGNADGIGSRYFMVGNNSQNRIQKTENGKMGTDDGGLKTGDIPVDYVNPIGVGKGYRRSLEIREMYPDESGIVTVEIRELERVVIHVGLNVRPLRSSRLPVGSTFDPEFGIFSWCPGPGFLGLYEFVFLEKCRNGEINKRIIHIRIAPK